MCHADSLVAFGVKWVVQPAGPKRCRENGVRDVHAFARADRIQVADPMGTKIPRGFREVTYNPFLYDTFVFAHDESTVRESSMVLFDLNKAYARRTQ